MEGDNVEESNYHPISILSVISKLFEKIVFNQLYQYFETDLIYSGQSGFRKNHSTLTYLLKITDDWYHGLDNGRMVG